MLQEIGMDKDFRFIIVPSYLNAKCPPGETLALLFTVEELERGRRRAESVIRSRMRKGVSRDNVIRQCLELS